MNYEIRDNRSLMSFLQNSDGRDEARPSNCSDRAVSVIFGGPRVVVAVFRGVLQEPLMINKLHRSTPSQNAAPIWCSVLRGYATLHRIDFNTFRAFRVFRSGLNCSS